ncbi:MAG: DUF47 domain-containing protein [Methylococcales bacterium]
MSIDQVDHQSLRPLEVIFKEHLDNTLECGKALNELFLNLVDPDHYISKVKNLEEIGDKLTAEAYSSLELLTYSEYIYITEQLTKRLDDIVDGMNDTARLIDICHPRQIENAAYEILATLVSMIETLQIEIAHYPDIELASIKLCTKTLKKHEENADLIYHEWRKKQRRVLVLSLIEENNWTEILGVLEQITDDAYHAGLLLERIVKFRQK